jgi:hypothetical protein
LSSKRSSLNDQNFSITIQRRKRIWDEKLCHDEWLLTLCNHLTACEYKDGRTGVGEPGQPDAWEAGLEAYPVQSLTNETLYYFEAMRNYLRYRFMEGLRGEVFLRDILAWTEFSLDNGDESKVSTFHPDMWQYWCDAVEQAKADYYKH